MSRISSWWNWLAPSNNRGRVTLLITFLGILGGVFAFFYLNFYKNPAEIKPPVTGVQIGGSVTAGRDVVINNINQNFPIEHYENSLKERNKEILEKIEQLEKTTQADPHQRVLLEKELAAIKAKHDNLQKAFEEQKVRLAEAYKAIDDFKQEFPPEQLERARKALVQGDVGAAEGLFRQALEKGTEQAEKGTKQAAEAAYQLGGLAESRIDYSQADKYYRQAVQLQPGNPRYLIASGRMAHILGDSNEAEQLLKRALIEVGRNPWGPIHLNLASCLDDLAAIFRSQGKYLEAESFCRRALGIRDSAVRLTD